jgi:hypothetical protein
MKFISLLILAVAMLGVSCERHDFDETKKLNEKHDSHSSAAGHGDVAAPHGAPAH